MFTSVLEAMVNTPLVKLSRLTHNLEGDILAKLGYLSPGFSKKDIVARQIIENAEKDGLLKPCQTVVELTSGNMGTGLVIVCSIKKYPFVAVMSKGNSTERARMMSALGAEVVLVDQLPESIPGRVSGGDLELVEKETQRICKERNAFRADQFQLEGNCQAHYLYTAPEILQQSDIPIDAFCDFVGSGGTFAGCSAAFKEKCPSIKCFIVEPEGAAILAGEKLTRSDHPIQGGGYSMLDLSFLRREHIDGFLQVKDQEVIDTTRRLAELEGIFAGFSSGANIAAAIQLLKGSCKGKTITTIICDSGLKYLSTDLWK